MSSFFVSNKQINKFNLHYRQVPVSPEGVHFGIITYGRTVYEQDIVKLDDATTVNKFVEILEEFDYRSERRKI